MKTFRIDYRRKWTHFLQHSYSQGWVGVGVGVRVRCVERYHLLKTAFRFRLRLRRLRSSEIWVVGASNRIGKTKPITKRGNVHWFIPQILLPTPTIWFSLDRKRSSHNRSRKKIETFWFFSLRFRSPYVSAYESDSDYVASENQPSVANADPLYHQSKSISSSSRSTRPPSCTFNHKPSRVGECLFFSSLLYAEELYQFSDARASSSG